MHHYNHGASCGRLIKSLIVARGDRGAAAAFAQSQGWEDGELIAKAAVGGLEASGTNGLRNYAELDFLALVWPMLALGKMTGTQRGRFDQGSLAQLSRGVGAWTGQSASAPVSLPVMSRLPALPPYKLTSLTIATEESAREAGSETMIAQGVAAATARAADAALLDGVDTDSATRPASITFGATTIAATGDAAGDAAAAIAGFGGSLLSACWFTHPATAAGAGLQLRDPALGALGGRLAGLPVYTSEGFSLDSSDAGDLVLVDQSALQIAGGDRATLSVSFQGAIEMADDPSGRTDTPAGGTSLVSLFQECAVAVLASLPLSWRVIGSGRVIVISGASYSGS